MTRYQELCRSRSLDRELRRLGCPYENADPRSTYWLEGYHAGVIQGLNDGKDIAMKVLAA